MAIDSVFTVSTILAILNGVINPAKRERVAIDIALAISVRLDGWCFAVLRCVNTTRSDLLTIIIGVEEFITNRLAVDVFDCFDLRRLAVFTILWCKDRTDCRLLAVLTNNEELVAGSAVFVDFSADLRCLTVVTLFTLIHGDR